MAIFVLIDRQNDIQNDCFIPWHVHRVITYVMVVLLEYIYTIIIPVYYEFCEECLPGTHQKIDYESE